MNDPRIAQQEVIDLAALLEEMPRESHREIIEFGRAAGGDAIAELMRKRLAEPVGDMQTMASDLVFLSTWIDDHNAHKDTEAQAWGRVSKVGEEFGEVIAAMIALTGQNPRKPANGTVAEVSEELLDVAITALGAVEHLQGNDGQAMRLLRGKIRRVAARARQG